LDQKRTKKDQNGPKTQKIFKALDILPLDEFLLLLYPSIGMYRVRHMSWHGVSNGCGTKMVEATPTEIFTAIC